MLEGSLDDAHAFLVDATVANCETLLNDLPSSMRNALRCVIASRLVEQVAYEKAGDLPTSDIASLIIQAANLERFAEKLVSNTEKPAAER